MQWEARLIRDALYANQHAPNRFVPVILPGHTVDGVPDFLAPATATVYHVREFTVAGTEALLRLLTSQPSEEQPPLGDRPFLPPRSPRPSSGPPASVLDSTSPGDCPPQSIQPPGRHATEGGRPTSIYLTRDSTSTPEPVASWPLDESGEAKIAKDTAGSHNGTATAVRWGNGSGGAALFDGRSTRVTTDGPVLKTGHGHSYTVSAWAWLDTLDTALEFVTVVSQSAGDLTAFFLQYWAKPNRWVSPGL